ncbi:unnamed protein product [Leptidea sinapis]|nr:unnamed protein product [Leptidea sinapis]
MRSSSSENDDSEDDFIRINDRARQEDLNMKELDRLKERLAKLTKATIERNRREEEQIEPSTSQSANVELNNFDIARKSPKEDCKEMSPTEMSSQKIVTLKKESPVKVASSPETKLPKKRTDRSWSRTPSRSRSRSRSRSASKSQSRVKSSRSRSQSRSASRSRSRSRSSRSRSRSYSSSRGSRSSRSSSYSSRSSSRSSRSSSRSTRSSRTMTGVYADYRRSSVSHRSQSRSKSRSKSRSPSIPRRAGSPSFLDRRRITRKKSRKYSTSSEDSTSSSSD